LKAHHSFNEKKEGMARFLVPRREVKSQGGKHIPTKVDPVFYNPASQLSRDISILFLQAYAKKLGRDLSVCELLTGTGIRSIRYLLEAPVNNVLLNDRSPLAVRLAKKNLALNNISENATVVNEDALRFIQVRLGNDLFDFVDIDPFGSPQRYYLAGLLVDMNGAIALTATDIPTLIGIYPETAFRRYGLTHLFRSEFEKETAIRALIASYQLRMLFFGRIFVPILSLYVNHYIRVILSRSKSKNDIKKKIGFIGYCNICDTRWIFPVGSKTHEIVAEHTHPVQLGGPLWLGPLHCSQIARQMNEFLDFNLWKEKRLKKLLPLIIAETNPFPPWFFDIHKQAKRRRSSPRSTTHVISILHESGYIAEKTHLSSVGIKTNALGQEIDL